MKISYTPVGVCSRKIDVTVEDGIISEVVFTGGCNGNTQGVSALCKGRTVEEVVSMLQGINCGGKGTSCPDQLTKALEKLQASN